VGDDLTTDASKVQISLVQQVFDEMFLKMALSQKLVKNEFSEAHSFN